MVEARCMRCKEQKTMLNPVIEMTARGGYMAKGTCSCGTKMCIVMSKDNAEKAIKAGAKKSY